MLFQICLSLNKKIPLKKNFFLIKKRFLLRREAKKMNEELLPLRVYPFPYRNNRKKRIKLFENEL